MLKIQYLNANLNKMQIKLIELKTTTEKSTKSNDEKKIN